MSDPVLADKDPATIIAEALADYKAATVSETNPNGTTLAPADPRRLHLLALLSLVTQLRGLIDFSGKQSLLRFVSDLWIDELAALWGADRLPAEPSKCQQRFTFSDSTLRTIEKGSRVTDGFNIWSVDEGTFAAGPLITCAVTCVVTGSATNGVAASQISELVDPIVGCISTENITETSGGRDLETLENYRERLRDVPESSSSSGPRLAYEAAALAASASVADAVALGPNDDDSTAYYPPSPGQVFVLIIEGTRDSTGAVTSVVPEPSNGTISTVETALTADDVRPLADEVIVQAPAFRDFDTIFSFFISDDRSESETDIIAAVEDAVSAYLIWQTSKIGRDINPSKLIADVMAAGAKRVIVNEPSFARLMRDECARSTGYVLIAYGGTEDD